MKEPSTKVQTPHAIPDNPYQIMRDSVETALETLLERKHLYQSVKIDTSILATFLKRGLAKKYERRPAPAIPIGNHSMPGTLRQGKADPVAIRERIDREAGREAENALLGQWEFWSNNDQKPEPFAIGPGAKLDDNELSPPKFSLPTIKIPCSLCDGTLPPHNPEYVGRRHRHYSEWISNNIQIFVFPYQCQNCKGEPILFMVKREGLKMTLVGRSQIGMIQTPEFIPSESAKYYRNSKIAFNTGFGLAALLYLRTMIEQYMRSVTKKDGRITGEDLAEEYAKTLPPEFRSRYVSFADVYQKLSNAIHTANEDAELFENAISDVEKHLEAKPFYMVPVKE